MRKHALWRLRSYVRPYALPLVGGVVLALVEVVSESMHPLIQGAIVDRALTQGLRSLLGPLVALGLGLGAFEVTLAFLRRFTAGRASHAMETDLRNDLYAHLQRLHVSFHDSWQSGQLLSRAIYDIGSIRRFVGWGGPFLIIMTFHFGVVVVLMFRLNWLLATIVAVGLLPVAWISYTFGRKYRVISRRVQDEQGDLSTIIEESATGIRIIKAFGRAPQMLKKFRKQAEQLKDSSIASVRLGARLWPLFESIPNTLTLIVLIVGGLTVINHPDVLSVGKLFAFIGYLNMLVWPLDALGWILAMSEESRTAAERLLEVMDTEPEIKDRPGAGVLAESRGRIRFDNVSFRYSEERDWVLRDVNLDVEPGETVALVGKTGCGKTTLAMLVPRLYEATSGRVLVDERDVKELTLSSLRSHIGLAFEEPILFSASVRENLLMGRPDASDDHIRAALVTAQAEFVYELPWGLDTRVGEQGYMLSGGQRQRLALARAVLGRPSILVLDDPLSSVDVHTEAMIEEALEKVLEGVTALLVVHRPSTLALADKVALLDEGRIVAFGTHHELMETVPLYRAVLSQEAELMTEGDGRRPRRLDPQGAKK